MRFKSNRITSDRTPSYPKGSVFTPEKLFDAGNIQDNIDMRPICTIIIIAATTDRRLLAGPTHVPALDDVSEALEGAVLWR